MQQKFIFYPLLLALSIWVALLGCDSNRFDDVSDAYPEDTIYKEVQAEETVEDTSAPEESFESYYKLKLTMPTGDEIVFDRDLSGKDEFFSFGSTHIAPAISLAMTETIYNASDSISYAIVTINFGIIQGTDLFPIQTPGVGAYNFSPSPPHIDIFLDGTEYTSTKPEVMGACSEGGKECRADENCDSGTCEGYLKAAEGLIQIDKWNKVPGGIFSGSIEGTLIEDSVKTPAPSIQVSGTYYFELPDTQQ